MINFKNVCKYISMVATLCLIISIMMAAFTVSVSAESDAQEKSFGSLEGNDSNTGTSVETIKTFENSDSTSGAAITAEVYNEGVNAAVNVSNLETIIANAQSIFDGAVEGDLPGQYPIGSKDILKAAVDHAKAVLEDSVATQDKIDSEAQTLQTAVNVFTQSVVKLIGDLNNDNIIDIFDLYIVSANFFNADWDSAKVADIDQDGKIDIEDLAMIARTILN